MVKKTSFVNGSELDFDAIVEFRNGKFVDVINGCYFDESVRLLVSKGKIIAMPGLDGSDTDIKPDVSIDLKGKAVLPGLFNTHCHINMLSPTLLASRKDIKASKAFKDQQLIKNMEECLAHGITYIRDAMTENLEDTRLLKERINKGEIHGPRIIQSVVVSQPDAYFSKKASFVMQIVRSLLGLASANFESQNCGILIFPMDATQQQVRDTVDRAIDERGAEAIKIGEQRNIMGSQQNDLTMMSMEQFQALTDQAVKRGVQSTIHQVSVESYRRGIEGGISSFAHMARDKDLTDQDIEAFIQAACIVEPTLSVGYDTSWPIDGEKPGENLKLLTDFRKNRYPFSHLAKEYYVPELQNCVVESYEKFSTNRFKTLGIINLKKVVQSYSCIATYGVENFRRLYQKGARMALANDGGIPPCTPAMMEYELGLFDLYLNSGSAGKIFTGADAVRVATINSAASMGLSDSMGSFEKGKVADLVVVDGDPLEDYQAIAGRAAALFMDGTMKINNCGLIVDKVSG